MCADVNESESFYHARTKAKISSDVLGPKIASDLKLNFLGEHALNPPSFSVHANLSRTNAILLLLGLSNHCHTFTSLCFVVFQTTELTTSVFSENIPSVRLS